MDNKILLGYVYTHYNMIVKQLEFWSPMHFSWSKDGYIFGNISFVHVYFLEKRIERRLTHSDSHIFIIIIFTRYLMIVLSGGGGVL